MHSVRPILHAANLHFLTTLRKTEKLRGLLDDDFLCQFSAQVQGRDQCLLVEVCRENTCSFTLSPQICEPL